jgi:hypothetical protein
VPVAIGSAKKQYKVSGYICIGLGALFILWGLNLLFNIPRESELIAASGVPTEVQEREHHGRYDRVTRTVTFRLDGHPAKYSDHSPHYDEIAGILRVNQPVKAWLSPRSESVFPVTEFVPVYKFERDGNVILTYPEEVEDAQFLVRFTIILGAAFVLIGIWSFSMVRWQSKIEVMQASNKQ